MSTNTVELSRSYASPVHRVSARVEDDVVVLQVSATRACAVVERSQSTVEERRYREASRGLLAAGAVVGGLGTMFLLTPGQSCDRWGVCVKEGREANQMTGIFFLAVGAGLALGSLGTIKERKSEHIEVGPALQRSLPECGEVAVDHLPVTLQWSDGTRLETVTNPRGRATVPLGKELLRDSSTVEAAVFIRGQRVNDVVLTHAP